MRSGDNTVKRGHFEMTSPHKRQTITRSTVLIKNFQERNGDLKRKYLAEGHCRTKRPLYAHSLAHLP